MAIILTNLKYQAVTNAYTNKGLRKWLLISSFALCVCTSDRVVAQPTQSKKELESERKSIIKEIKETDRLLKKTKQNKEAAFDKFVALQSQIKRREDLLTTLSSEIESTEENISRTNQVISALSQDIEERKEEYGRMLRSAYRFKMMKNPLLFMLSASSLNEAFRRWLFLRQYDKFRKKQAEAIAYTRQILAKKIVQLEDSRLEKQTLAEDVLSQTSTLANERDAKTKMLKELQKDEKKLKEELEEKRQAQVALDGAIEEIIKREIRKRAEESARIAADRKRQDQKKKQEETKKQQDGSDQTKQNNRTGQEEEVGEAPEDIAAIGFRKNKGKLPWPVESGFISRSFGNNPHPTFPNIMVPNNGIDIRTDDMSNVKVVAEGEVVGVTFVPGHDYTVIVQHGGSYYTVYSNIMEAYVQKGQNLKSGDKVGRVSANPLSGTSELHFELWHNKERLNPTGWIKK